MKTLPLTCGGAPSLYGDLDAAGMPEPTDTYRPMSHQSVATLARRGLRKDLDLKPHTEIFGLARDGRQMFGAITARPREAGGGHGLAIAFQNSVDQSLSLRWGVGVHVFGCGVLSIAEISPPRRHTRLLDDVAVRELAELLERADGIVTEIEADFARWSTRKASIDDVGSVLGQALARNHIHGQALSRAFAHWHGPPHRKLRPRTVWSAYLAACRATQIIHPMRTLRAYAGIHALFREKFSEQTQAAAVVDDKEVVP